MVDAVLHCVARHEDRPFASDGAREPASLEARVVQDADNLDAMGAIGVARCFAYGGAHGRALGRPDDRGREGPYDPAAGGGSAVAHFHEKLLRLRGAMGTRAGRRRAAGRHAYMVRFLARYGREWAGEA
jgi:uncharacterized protein